MPLYRVGGNLYATMVVWGMPTGGAVNTAGFNDLTNVAGPRLLPYQPWWIAGVPALLARTPSGSVPAAPGGGPFALVASAEVEGANGGTTSAIDTTGARLFVVVVTGLTSGNTAAVSDSKGNTWASTTAVTETPGGTKIQLSYCLNPTSVGSGHTFTVAGGTSSFQWMSVGAFSAGGTVSLDQNVQTTTNTVSITPTSDGQLVFAGWHELFSTAYSVTGLTELHDNPPDGSVDVGGTSGYVIQTTAATVSPVWTAVGGFGGSARHGTIASFSSTGGGTPLVLTQEGFRWRNDDGSETAATWKAAQDANTSLTLGGAARLRTIIDTTTAATITPTLYYKKSTDSIWQPVPVGPTSGGGGGTFAKYRSFNGSSDTVTWTMGNLSGVSANPQTMVAVVRLVGAPADCELMFTPGWDPVDWFYIASTTDVAYYDGATNTFGPDWTPGSASTDWRLLVIRSVSGSASKWSVSKYGGTSWPTPTHTTSSTLGSRSYGTSGVITMASPPMQVDIVCIARFNTDLTDAQINAMTGGVAAIQATPGITNLWMLGQATPADLVGTSTLSALTGSTLSSGDSPFLAAAGGGGSDNPVYIKTSSNITAGGQATTAQLTPPAGSGSGGLDDDFSGSSVSSPPWAVYNRVGDLANSEVNGVIPANVRVSSGTLKIDSKFEDVVIGDSETAPATYHYTSGQIGQSSTPFMYGDVQVRAKIPGGTGTWPCIWMLGYQWQATQPYTANTPGHNWPVDGWCEIDIAEFMYGERDEVNCSLHYQTAGAPYPAALPFDSTTRFMVYRLLWTATSLTWQVDAEDGVGWRTLRTVTGAAGTAVPNVPMYLIIHTAIGGAGGTPNSSTFPVTMEVDYARVTTDSGTVPFSVGRMWDDENGIDTVSI